MTQQEQIATFLNQCITLPRVPNSYWMYEQSYLMQPRPAAEQVAHELLQLGEFRALQLGTWFGTTDGEVITQAVEMVTPPFYRQDVELLVEALKLAAALQQTEGQDKAGKIALGAFSVAALIAVGLGSAGGRRAAWAA